MRILLALAVAATLAGCASMPGPVAGTKDAGASSVAVVMTSEPGAAQARQAAIDAIKTYEEGQSREPLTTLETLVRDSLRNPAESAAMAQDLAAVLSSDATPAAKQFACRQLAIVGTPLQVPALEPLLLNEETADMARYALEPIQGEEVDRALLAALPKAPEKAKIGIINSLGARRSAAAVRELEKLAQDTNPAVAEAAAAALAKCRP
jgi:uncharacterized protein YceK